MTGADFFLSVVAGVVSDTVLDRLRGRDSLCALVRLSLERATSAHEDLLRKHTRSSDGKVPNPKPYVDKDIFTRVWAGTLDCDPRDLTSVVPHLREVVVLPGCPLAPDDHANLLALVLDTATREFRAALPDHPRAKSEWDIAHDVSIEDKLDAAIDLLDEIKTRTRAAEALPRQGISGASNAHEGEEGPPKVSLAKLPGTDPDLFGREKELQLLDEAWEDPDAHVVAFIAFGGVGK